MIIADPDARVRQQAIVAAGNLEFDGTPQWAVSDRLSKALTDAYSHEQEAPVRAEIAKTFAFTVPTAAGRMCLRRALADVTPEVLEFALVGLARHQDVESLPRMVKLLGHKSEPVRVMAAQAVARFGPLAKPFAVQLRAARDIETGDVARRTLEGALQTIEGPR